MAVTGAAAVVAGLLLAAVLAGRSGDGPQLAGAALSPTASPSSSAPPIDTTGFGGDLARTVTDTVRRPELIRARAGQRNLLAGPDPHCPASPLGA